MIDASVIRLIFYNSDINLKIELPIEQLDLLHSLCDESNPYETGGIIIGRYSDDGLTAFISEITNSPDDSIKKMTSFKRGINGLKKKLDTLWKDDLYYLGEWHYHPNSSSTPSEYDIKQMISLSKNKRLNCPEPILIIIGGNKSNWTYGVSVIFNKMIVCFYEVKE